MEFNAPVSRVVTSVVDASGGAKVAASDAVNSRQQNSRHTLTIANTGNSTVYFGGSDVSAENGIPLAAGEKITIPVMTTNADQIYVTGGSVTIAEWF
jgi:hypothetical protein